MGGYLWYFVCGGALMLLISCGAKLEDDNSILVNTQDEYFQERILEDLEGKGIEYEVVEDTAIRVDNSDAQYVMYRLNQLSSEALPAHRSVALVQPFRQRFVKLLEEHDIDFEEVELGGQQWIVWREGDSDQVEELLDKVMYTD